MRWTPLLLLVLLHAVAPACVQQTIHVLPIGLSLAPGSLGGTLKIVASDNEEVTLCAGSGVSLSSSQFFGDRDITFTLPAPGLFSLGITAKFANCPPATTKVSIWADPAASSTVGVELNCTNRLTATVGSQGTGNRAVAKIVSVVNNTSCGAGPDNYSGLASEGAFPFGYLATSSQGQCRCSTSVCAANNRGPCVGTDASVHCSCANPHHQGDGINCQVVYEPVQVGVAPKPQLTASSVDASPYCAAHRGTFESIEGWCAQWQQLGDWLQADLTTPTWIGKMAIKARGPNPQWLTSFKLQYSNSTTGFVDLATLTGPVNAVDPVEHVFSPVVAQYWRILVLAYSGHPSCRIELYTYSHSLANTPVGVGQSPKPALTAQSQHADMPANKGYLTQDGWGSLTGANNEWIQADLLTPIWIGKIVTRGRVELRDRDNSYCTSFILQYSHDAVSFTQLGGTYTGNSGVGSKINSLGAGMKARYWRVIPTASVVWPVLRFELYTSP